LVTVQLKLRGIFGHAFVCWGNAAEAEDGEPKNAAEYAPMDKNRNRTGATAGEGDHVVIRA